MSLEKDITQIKKLAEQEEIFKAATPEQIEKRRDPAWKGITHEYPCQVCDKPATYNLQKMWHRYSITPDGDFENEKSWEAGGGEWYCDEHAKQEGVI